MLDRSQTELRQIQTDPDRFRRIQSDLRDVDAVPGSCKSHPILLGTQEKAEDPPPEEAANAFHKVGDASSDS